MRADVQPADEHLAQIGHAYQLGRLVPGVIHEVNNPLFAVLGLLEQVLVDLGPGSPHERRLQLVEQSAVEIRDVVRALIGLAREPAGAPAAVELAPAVRATVELWERTSAARDVDATVEGAAGLTVLAAGRGISVPLLALLSNAERALPDGGAIRVELADAGPDALVRVNDTGEGVPASLRDVVFDPGFSTRDAPGYGLAIARAVARSQGGDVVLEPGGAGATFALRLPAA
jgi:two-component system NtrC family sensor kinase